MALLLRLLSCSLLVTLLLLSSSLLVTLPRLQLILLLRLPRKVLRLFLLKTFGMTLHTFHGMRINWTEAVGVCYWIHSDTPPWNASTRVACFGSVVACLGV